MKEKVTGDVMEILLQAVESGIINLPSTQEQLRMKKRSDVLKKYNIWQSEDGIYRVHLGNGKKNRKTMQRKNLLDLQDAIIEYEESIPGNKTYRFGDLFEEYKEYKRDTYCSDNTIFKYEHDYNRFFKDSDLEKTDIRIIKETDITVFMIDKIETMNLCPSAGKALWSYVSGCFHYACIKRYIETDPCEHVDTAAFAKHYDRTPKHEAERRIYTDDEQEALLDQLVRDINRKPEYIPNYAVLLSVYTGMRVSELAALKWEDIDMNRETITIRRSEKVDQKTRERTVAGTKTGKERIFPLIDEIKKILEAVKKIEMGHGYMGEFVFQDKDGRISIGKISSCLQRRCMQAGIPVKYTHALRRTLNSNMKREGAATVLTSALLGNNERTNDGYYTYDTSRMDEKQAYVEKAVRCCVNGKRAE